MNIFDAIANNNIARVKELLDSGININIENQNGNTPLYHACFCDNFDIVKLLLEFPYSKKDVTVDAVYNKDDLLSSGFDSDSEIFKTLTSSYSYTEDKSIDVNAKTRDNWSPLHRACYHENVDIVKLLLEHPSINVNAKDNYGRTPLHIACDFMLIKIVKLLLDNPKTDVNSENKEGDTVLKKAWQRDRKEYIKLLLTRKDIDVNIWEIEDYYKEKNYFLFSVFKRYDLDTLLLLLQNNILDINVVSGSNNTILHSIFSNYFIDYYPKIKLLLTHPKINVNIQNKNGYSPLYIVCLKNKKEMIKLLLEYPKTKIDFDITEFKDNIEIYNSLKKNNNVKLTRVNTILDSIEN